MLSDAICHHYIPAIICSAKFKADCLNNNNLDYSLPLPIMNSCYPHQQECLRMRLLEICKWFLSEHTLKFVFRHGNVVPESFGWIRIIGVGVRADSRFAPSQWETSLQSNAVSHWLGANLESALGVCHPCSCCSSAAAALWQGCQHPWFKLYTYCIGPVSWKHG